MTPYLPIQNSFLNPTCSWIKRLYKDHRCVFNFRCFQGSRKSFKNMSFMYLELRRYLKCLLPKLLIYLRQLRDLCSWICYWNIVSNVCRGKRKKSLLHHVFCLLASPFLFFIARLQLNFIYVYMHIRILLYYIYIYTHTHIHTHIFVYIYRYTMIINILWCFDQLNFPGEMEYWI